MLSGDIVPETDNREAETSEGQKKKKKKKKTKQNKSGLLSSVFYISSSPWFLSFVSVCLMSLDG